MPGHIRRATHADLPAIETFERAYMREIEPHNQQRWADAMPRHVAQWTENLPRMFVLVQDGEAAGHGFWQHSGEQAVLASLFVAPQWRRQGWGTALLRRFEADAHAQGLIRFALGVHENNPARHLYTQAGYRQTHAQDGYIFCEKVSGKGVSPPPPVIPPPVDTPPTP